MLEAIRRAIRSSAAVLAIGSALAGAAHAQAFPSRNLSIVVPFTAGVGIDVLARDIAGVIEKRLGRPVVVENRPGAATMLASRYVADSAPDGHTLLLSGLSSALAPEVNAAAGGRNHVKDMVHLAPIAMVPNFLTIHGDLPVRSVAEFVAYAKANPDRLSYGSPGVGSGPNLQFELFKASAGIQVAHVPYKGFDALYADLVAGRIQATVTDYVTGQAFVQAGKLRILATTLADRLPSLPQYATMAESGQPAVTALPWVGLSVAKGTPPAVISTLHSAVLEAIASPAVAARLKAQGLEPLNMQDQPQFQAFVTRDIDRWARVIRASGIKVE